MWIDGANYGILALLATASGGGLWFVVRLIYRFQRDFTDRYAAEIVALKAENAAEIAGLRARIDVVEAENRRLHRELIACVTERGMLRALVRHNGIEWNPADWGALPDEP